MIELDIAIEKLQSKIKPIEKTYRVAILDAYDCILGEDIYAKISVPSFPKAAMDGYALRSIDTLNAGKEKPVKLKVIGEILAGDDKNFNINPFEAVRIMTGGKIPKGADCVIKQEDTDYGEDNMLVYKKAEPFDNYCKVGEDILKGDLLIKKYTKVNSVHIGIMASIGIAFVAVLEKVKVGIITTGSEIVMPGEELSEGKIYNSCGFIFASKIKAANLKVEFLINCEDSMKTLKKAVNDNIDKVDILLTSGGVSVGKKDLMPYLIEEIGGEKLFHKVKIKPGTHAMASVYKDKIILSLSGNPFAALTTFELLFFPMIEVYTKDGEYGLKYKTCIYKGERLKENILTRYVRAFEKDGEVKVLSDIHSSSILSNMARCNCFIKQPPLKEVYNNEEVEIVYIKNI